jgi:DNA repair protein RecO (recombination protein O)
MALYKADAIILRTRAWGEADRIVTLLTPERGKITAIAKGARRPRNRLTAGMQLFSYGELLLSTGASLDSINQCEIKESFRDLRDDLDKMAYGAYITELVDELVPEHEPDEGMFALVLALLQLLRHRNPRIVAAIAALQLLVRAGYRPQVSHCAHCLQSLVPEGAYFSSVLGGVLCANCRDADSTALGICTETPQWLDRLMKFDIGNAERFSISGTLLGEVEQVLQQYLQHQLEKDLKAGKFLASLNRGNRAP